MSKPPKLTPWQQWATDYMAKRESDTGHPTWGDMDNEDADRYSHAAWEECKRRVLEIIEEDGRFGLGDAYRRIKKL